MNRSILGLVIVGLAMWPSATAFAADNGDKVRKAKEAEYDAVYWGPTLSVEEAAKAAATKGATLVLWCGNAAEWLSKAGYDISRKAVMEMLFEGKGIPDVAGGTVAIECWHMEKVPYVVFRGVNSTVKQRDVKIPEPNKHQFWIGYRKTKKNDAARPAKATVQISNGFAPNRFLDAHLPDTHKDGCAVQLWGKVGGANQRWYTEDAGDGFVRIICADSGYCLDAHQPAVDKDGCEVQLWHIIPNNHNQHWKLEDAGGGYKRIVCRMGGLVLDAHAPDIAVDGCNVQLWHKLPDNKNQLWKFE